MLLKIILRNNRETHINPVIYFDICDLDLNT